MKTISKLNSQKIGKGELPFYICVQNIFCPKIYEQKHTCSSRQIMTNENK